MFEVGKTEELPFSLEHEIERIAARAAMYRNQGKKDVWIYFIKNRCHCHPIELPVINQFFIAHYKCSKLLKSLSHSEWKMLEHKIVAAHKKGDSKCHHQKH